MGLTRKPVFIRVVKIGPLGPGERRRETFLMGTEDHEELVCKAASGQYRIYEGRDNVTRRYIWEKKHGRRI